MTHTFTLWYTLKGHTPSPSGAHCKDTHLHPLVHTEIIHYTFNLWFTLKNTRLRCGAQLSDIQDVYPLMYTKIAHVYLTIQSGKTHVYLTIQNEITQIVHPFSHSTMTHNSLTPLYTLK